jgi:hypothetical protein
VKTPAALRTAHHRTFETQDVECHAAFDAIAQQVHRVGTARLAERRMPQQIDAAARERRRQIAHVGVEQRQGATAATAGLEPEQIHVGDTPDI